MSILTAYINKEQKIKQIQEEIDRLKNDDRLKSEFQFKEKLESLMHDFDKKASEVISILAPQQTPHKTLISKSNGRRAKRKLKVFKNPHTGEVVETRGGNQNTLKAWKREYGSEIVDKWLVRTED